jgi:hypothetical protein
MNTLGWTHFDWPRPTEDDGGDDVEHLPFAFLCLVSARSSCDDVEKRTVVPSVIPPSDGRDKQGEGIPNPKRGCVATIVNRQLTTARLDGDGSKTAKGIQKKSNDKKEHNSAADARAFCLCLVVDAD